VVDRRLHVANRAANPADGPLLKAGVERSRSWSAQAPCKVIADRGHGEAKVDKDRTATGSVPVTGSGRAPERV